MSWSNILRSCRLPLSERSFVVFAIACIALTRVAVIMLTPDSANSPDIRIYQATGQAVLAGVNPYNFADKPDVRRALKNQTAATQDYVAQTQQRWDSYVAANLPASTALYAVFEKVSRGSILIWRFLFILGDMAIFLGLVAFFRTIRGGSTNAADQIGIFCLSVLYPALIVNGTALAEDKQFQTALLLFSAALLLSRKPTTAGRGLGIGVVLSLSVLFKMFGIFLLPLWLERARREWPRFPLWTTLGGLVPLVLSFGAFGTYFIGIMASRANENSTGGTGHGSPWVFLPWLSQNEFLLMRVVTVVLLAVVMIVLMMKRRIDLTNFCAALAVMFACIWLDKGSLDRMNITIIFAIAALATLSSQRFLVLTLLATFVSGFTYLFAVGLLKVDVETADAAITLVLLCAYFGALIGGSWWREPLVSNTQPEGLK